LPPDELNRGPIINPADALTALLERYCLDDLQQANLVGYSASAGWRIRRELCRPGTAIIGMRSTATDPISCLMTSRGSLPHCLDPLALAERDHITLERIKQLKRIYVTLSVLDAAVLRALGLPAIVGLGTRNMDWSGLEKYRRRTGEETYADAMEEFYCPARSNGPDSSPAAPPDAVAEEGGPPEASGPDAQPSGKSDAIPASPPELAADEGGSPEALEPDEQTPGASSREPPPLVRNRHECPDWPAQGYAPGCQPTLIIVGWSPWKLTYPYARLLTRVADYLGSVSRNMDVEFDISVWQPDRAEIEKLRARLKWRYLPKITESLSECLDNDDRFFELDEFATSASNSKQSEPTPLDFLTARQDLIDALTGVDFRQRAGLRPDAIPRAKAAYHECVQRDLIRPMFESAMAEPDSLIRMSGVNLATSSTLIHELGPHMHVYLDKMLGSPSEEEPDDRIFEAYLTKASQTT